MFARYEAPGPSDKRAVAALSPRAAAAALALARTPYTYTRNPAVTTQIDLLQIQYSLSI